jgi:serine/threonine protein kinase
MSALVNDCFDFALQGKLRGLMVAIKRCFSSGSSLDRKDLSLQFESEIKLLLRLHHKNIFNHLGYCIERGERILVYEYVPNGGLGKFIFGIFLLMLIIVKINSETIYF